MTPAQAQTLLGDLSRKFQFIPPAEEHEFWMRRLEPLGYTIGARVMSRLGTARSWPTGADFDRVLGELTTRIQVVPAPSVMPPAAPPPRRVLDRTENATKAREIRTALRERMRSVRS